MADIRPTLAPVQPASHPVKDFFTNPENLTAGLVFLASLAQPKRPGQSDFGAFAQRAVGGVALKGALQNQTKGRRTAEEELARKHIAEQRQAELEQMRVNIARSAVDVQREGIHSQSATAEQERLARQKLQETPQAITGAQTDLLKSEAERNRALAESKVNPQAQLFQDYIKTATEKELENAALNNRPPDIAGVLKGASDFITGLGAMGTEFVRDPDGTVSVRVRPVPGNPTATPPAAPIVTAPPPVTSPGGRGRPTTKPMTISARAEAEATRQAGLREQQNLAGAASAFEAQQATLSSAQLSGADESALRALLKDPKTSKRDAIAIRMQLRDRVQQRINAGFERLRD